jgi:hypothetical protein
MATNPLHGRKEPESFSEAEVYQALSWGMSDAEARKLAKFMSDDPAVTATVPTLSDLGPLTTLYSENMLLLLSLVSDETNRKVEQRIVQMRLGKEMSPEERAQWEKRRAEFRSQLVKSGKIDDA